MKYVERTNQTYGKLRVLGLLYETASNIYWKCRCDCGKELVVRESNLLSKKSCGCITVTPLNQVVPLSSRLPKKVNTASSSYSLAIKVANIFLTITAYLLMVAGVYRI